MSSRIRRRPQPDPVPALEDLHPVLAQVLATRGVNSADQLASTLDHLLPPSGFAGLEEAAELLAESIEQDHHILVVGDYDADGATSTALAVSCLRAMGCDSIDFLVPNRFEYGYGLTPEIVDEASTQSPHLIVTVDNGISSMEGIKCAQGHGIRTLITDHHLPGPDLPEADVIVNPNHPDCNFPSKNLAGVGVIFYVMMALRSHLRERNWFDRRGIDEPNIANYLDLVALGTVADLVPLDHNNRIMVQQGMMRIRAGQCRPGVLALLEISRRQFRRAVPGDLSFAVAPRLNAAGRLDDISTGIACLLAEDLSTARQIAGQLDMLNQDRKFIEKGMQNEAMNILKQQVKAAKGEMPLALCLFEPDWHQGVVGLVASRIKDRVHRPVAAFARAEDSAPGVGLLRGSARSIPGLHIRDVLERVSTRHPGLIDKFGGHAMAAGLSLFEPKLQEFREAFCEAAGEFLEGVELDAIIESDGELPAPHLNLDLAREIRYAGAWGQHFPEPVFDGVFSVMQQDLVANRHLKLVLQNPAPHGEPLRAIVFNVDRRYWPRWEVNTVRIAYRLDCNEHRGRELLQLVVQYIEQQ